MIAADGSDKVSSTKVKTRFLDEVNIMGDEISKFSLLTRHVHIHDLSLVLTPRAEKVCNSSPAFGVGGVNQFFCQYRQT
jgi:hypothetical protein